MVQAKVCGIRSDSDLEIALKAGADAVGFLCGLTHFSEDRLEPEEAQRLIAHVRGRAIAVLVTHLSEPGEIAALFTEVGADMIQLHGEMTRRQVREVRRVLPTTWLAKAVHVPEDSTRATVLHGAREAARSVDAVLLDSRTVDRLGGTGKTHDWTISAELVRQLDVPVVLAGGLGPNNSAAAIAAVHPAAIDANSGLEDAAGDKSISKVTVYVAAAHAVAAQRPAFAASR